SSTVNTASIKDNAVDENIVYGCADDPNMLNLEDIVYTDDDEDVGAEADMTNLDTHIPVSPISITRIYKDHPVEQIIRDIHSAPQTRRMTKRVTDHGYTQEKGLDYDEVFAPVARIAVIRLFLAYASFKDFVVYLMDVKSVFLYDKIEEEVYVCQPLGFEDPEFPDRVYKVEKALYDLHHAPRVCTPMETSKPLMKDENAEDVDFHLYRSMIGSLIIFRYLKGQPKLGLWYHKDSPFDLEAYTDSDYIGASLDRKSTTLGCQFLGSTLISWQCKKQTVVANSTTEAEYVAASNSCGQVLWIQNQMIDYGYNFMNTKIFIDNESTICIVKNLVFHSKTKHIKIRHHFIRDSYEKRLIQVIKIHTDHNVADLLTNAFDVSRFLFLTASIGMLNI
ncbi:putative reverse transcriptase, RNA-dependent DNA polymerase, partial [Tanacetum coccineum]